jgi:hypothetical protein
VEASPAVAIVPSEDDDLYPNLIADDTVTLLPGAIVQQISIHACMLNSPLRLLCRVSLAVFGQLQ